MFSFSTRFIVSNHIRYEVKCKILGKRFVLYISVFKNWKKKRFGIGESKTIKKIIRRKKNEITSSSKGTQTRSSV